MDISFVIITGGSKPKHVDRLLKSIKKQIEELKNKEKQYYLQNSNTIFEYFEHKKNICNDNEKKSSKLDMFFKVNNKNNDVNNNHNHNTNNNSKNLTTQK